MLRDFLPRWPAAVSLDIKLYKRRFPEGKDRADYLFFNGRVVCEFKEITDVKVATKVEKVAKMGTLPQEIFDREIHSSAIRVLGRADGQIADTKEVLGLPGALGLVILDNRMAKVMSAPALCAAADWAMQRGLPQVDGVLCLDYLNQYHSTDGPHSFCQIVTRRTPRAEILSALMNVFMADFTRHLGVPLLAGRNLTESHLNWTVDKEGKFSHHEAKFDTTMP